MQEHLENEWYSVRYSGEIPEVALFSSYHYLTTDASGPQLCLAEPHYRKLVHAAELRFQEIVLRDLDHANRLTPAYRGIKRSMVNWERFVTFCQRHRLDPASFQQQVAETLLSFLERELAEVRVHQRTSCLNCTQEELGNFAYRLDLAITSLPAGWQSLVDDCAAD